METYPIKHTVWYLNRSENSWIEKRLHCQRMLDGNIARRNMAGSATFEKSLLEREIGFSDRDEQAIV